MPKAKMYWTDVWKKLWPVALVRSSPVDECSSGIFNTCLKMFEEESQRRSLTCSSCLLHIMLLSYFLSLVHTAQLLHFRFGRETSSFPSLFTLNVGVYEG